MVLKASHEFGIYGIPVACLRDEMTKNLQEKLSF